MQSGLFNMKTNNKTYIWLFLSIAWALLIFYFCTMPPEKIPETNIPYADKVVHFGFFFVQSVLLSLMFNFQAKNSYFQIIFLATLLTFIYGGLIEILQSRFFNRTGDFYDLLADILGGFVGTITYPTLLKIYRKAFKKYR
jgi:VanZ family protein